MSRTYAGILLFTKCMRENLKDCRKVFEEFRDKNRSQINVMVTHI